MLPDNGNLPRPLAIFILLVILSGFIAMCVISVGDSDTINNKDTIIHAQPKLWR